MNSNLQFGASVNKFTQFGSDFQQLVKFVQSAEDLGFHHIRSLDHVVGIVAEKHGGIAATPYTDKSIIREVFTLFAYLAAVTTRIRFITGVLALPQRQTVLVAKQAAEIDILSSGRLTIGCAVGYNPFEFRAMGQDFHDRGKRFEEQIEVLRMLWTQPDASYRGTYHDFVNVSLSPLPIQRPIPLYFGMGRSNNPIPPDVVLRRVGRLADGWLPLFVPDAAARAAVATVHAAAAEAGRDPAKLVMEMAMTTESRTSKEIFDEIKRYEDFGAHRISFIFSGDTPEEQSEELKRIADILHAGWLT